jgi:hypothetical protein
MNSRSGYGSVKARSSGPIRIHNTVTNTDIQAGVEPITNDRKTSGSFSFLLHGGVAYPQLQPTRRDKTSVGDPDPELEDP